MTSGTGASNGRLLAFTRDYRCSAITSNGISLAGRITVVLAVERIAHRTLHPVHAFLLAATVPLFLGTLLADMAYWSTYHVQWSNFASWLNLAGLLFGGLTLLLALFGLRHSSRRGGRYLVYVLLLLAMWVLAFFNVLVHVKDAFAAMPAGLVLSVIVAVLACAATWLGFSSLHTGGAP